MTEHLRHLPRRAFLGAAALALASCTRGPPKGAPSWQNQRASASDAPAILPFGRLYTLVLVRNQCRGVAQRGYAANRRSVDAMR